jgi:hypothetical protein
MKTEQELQQQIDKLPAEIAPPRDLWPELAARLAQTPQQAVENTLISETTITATQTTRQVKTVSSLKNQSGWWLAAAATALLTLWGPWQQSDLQPDIAQNDGAEIAEFGTSSFDNAFRRQMQPGRVPASSKTQWRLSNDFEQQRALQLAQIRQVPEIYQDWKQQLQIWQQATSLVLLALQYQPDEPGLLRQLAHLQKQELAYLQKVVLADRT